MKIFVTGTRGIPDIPGGIEKHCQELYPLIVFHGHEVILATRSSYVVLHQAKWQGVMLNHLFAPHQKSLEAIIHTFLAVIKARLNRVDLVHIHAVGPGLMVPFAKLLGLKVVWTSHGPDYDRDKWGSVAKKILRLGEWLAGKYTDEVIVISEVIRGIVRQRCGRDSHIIYNGVSIPEKNTGTNHLVDLNIIADKYVLAVARFVPEKGLHDLVEAFAMFEGDYQLVIAGDTDHQSDYSDRLKEEAAKDPRIVLTGYITGECLSQVYSHAGLFVLPSYHEGLPIALLEAMSYELPVLVSDIPANKEVELSPERFFSCGDVEQLKDKIQTLMEFGLPEKELYDYRLQIAEKYNWLKIAEQTICVYKKTLDQA